MRRSTGAVVANPVLVGAVTALVVVGTNGSPALAL